MSPDDTAAGRRVPTSEVLYALGGFVGGVVLWLVMMWPDKFAGFRPGDLWLRVDILIGAVAALALPLRHRRPRLVTFALIATTAVAASTAASAALAVISLTAARRGRDVVGVLALWVAAGVVFNVLHSSPYGSDRVANLIITVLSAVSVIAIGMFLGARREVLATLRERAETLEREQAMREARAIAEERARIARELHDVLAHRMSLIALHSGALSFRTDLTAQQRQDAADTIQHSAHHALNELRQVLGVLRPDTGGLEPPSSGIDDIPALIDQCREAGVDVHFDISTREHPAPETHSLHAYRIIQEGLTNAMKHAPGEPVHVSVRQDGPKLNIELRNPVSEAGTSRHTSSGHGLLGLTERARLSGGGLRFGISQGRDFVVSAWLPWGRDER